jgi:hypothetical protein
MKYIIIALLFVLMGCSTKTPTETIVSESVNRIDQVIDYANNNIPDTPDTVFLKEELKACRVSLISCDQSCKAELKAEKNNTAYWKLACGALVGALVALFYFFIRK